MALHQTPPFLPSSPDCRDRQSAHTASGPHACPHACPHNCNTRRAGIPTGQSPVTVPNYSLVSGCLVPISHHNFYNQLDSFEGIQTNPPPPPSYIHSYRPWFTYFCLQGYRRRRPHQFLTDGESSKGHHGPEESQHGRR